MNGNVKEFAQIRLYVLHTKQYEFAIVTSGVGGNVSTFVSINSLTLSKSPFFTAQPRSLILVLELFGIILCSSRISLLNGQEANRTRQYYFYVLLIVQTDVETCSKSVFVQSPVSKAESASALIMNAYVHLEIG